MNEYTFVWTFQADNIEQAEDYAAALGPIRGVRGRTALYYHDPISGDQKLWAEPVSTSAELVARRSRE
jgi:hypothetical protein